MSISASERKLADKLLKATLDILDDYHRSMRGVQYSLPRSKAVQAHISVGYGKLQISCNSQTILNYVADRLRAHLYRGEPLGDTLTLGSALTITIPT